MNDKGDSDFSPKAFLKARRPEQFSDTVSVERTELDRSLLEFHLGSITTRSQEVPFQRFAKRLCERTVCPNLLPQTGPTGGGDSKVDSETYPVAEELSLAWYVGVASGAQAERWAFAVSAKENWKPKLRDDVAKAVETGRGYTKVFFVTSQAVSDRNRAKEEDELRAKHGIEVRIYDRTWILDHVFTDKLTEIAVEELGVTALSRKDVLTGPMDASRVQRLEEIDNLITESIAAGNSGPHLADLAIESAQLARSLERARTEVTGRLRRAEELAARHGTDRQRVEAAYQMAWSLFWWFEDYDAFLEQYPKVEALARDSTNTYDLERLANLWQLLNGRAGKGTTESAADLPARTATLIASLERLATDDARPSAALQAEALLCEVRISQAAARRTDPRTEFRKLREIVVRSKGLIGFPLQPLVEIVTELGSVVRPSKEFDELFETVVETAAAAEGEIRGAELLVMRGDQLLAQGRPSEAIATLGRALADLFKHESREKAVHALYLCGCAYADAGLLWAARGNLLTAASVATNDLWQYGDVTPYQAACYRRLKWIELQLGRVPHALTWHELDTVVRGQLVARGFVRHHVKDDDAPFEVILGQLFLRAELSELRHIERLPAGLDRLGLELAADALLFALGHEERLAETAPALGMNDARSAALRWRNLSADGPTASRPELGLHRTTTMTSNVVGCRITVTCETDEPCVEIAEAIIATLEGFLATSALNRALAAEPEATIHVSASDFVVGPLATSVTIRGGRPHVDVRCSREAASATPDTIRVLREATFDGAVQLLARCVMFRDAKVDLEALFRDERVADRASSFASGIGTQANVLGRLPKTSLSAWLDANDPRFPLHRLESWDIGEPDVAPEPAAAEPPSAGGPPDPDALANASHRSMSTVSPIRLQLWDRAGWHGVAYLTSPSFSSPPAMALMFSDEEAPIEIFRLWKQEQARGELQLRISVVRGIDKTKPHAYSVMIGGDPAAVKAGAGFVTMVARLHHMDPTSSVNLERFLEGYEKTGRYFLEPAYKSKESPITDAPAFAPERFRIELTSLKVMHAWQVGPNDMERAAIHEGRDPIIPDGVIDAPVLELLRENREKKQLARKAEDARTKARKRERLLKKKQKKRTR